MDVAERGIAAAFAAREPIEVAGRATIEALGARGGRIDAAVVGRVVGTVLGARLVAGEGLALVVVREAVLVPALVEVVVEGVGLLVVVELDAVPAGRLGAAIAETTRLVGPAAAERTPGVEVGILLAFTGREAAVEPTRPIFGRAATVLGVAFGGWAKGLSSSLRQSDGVRFKRKGTRIPSSGSRKISQLLVKPLASSSPSSRILLRSAA